MVSTETLRRVRDLLFKELVLPGDTGFWGVGIGDGGNTLPRQVQGKEEG